METETGKEEPSGSRRESLWLLDRADDLMRGVALASWLSVASVFRLARALLAPDSAVRIKDLMANHQILPPTVGLFVAAVVSALAFGYVSFPSDTRFDVLPKLASASAESWLLVAGPGLISLWLTAFIMAALLRFASRNKTIDVMGTLMHALAAFGILASATIAGCQWLWIQLALSFGSSIAEILDVTLSITLAVALAGALAVAGWRYGQQALPKTLRPRWRRHVVLYALAPLCFAGSVPVALIGQLWMSLTVMPKLSLSAETEHLNPELRAYGQECFAISDGVICNVLLYARADVMAGSLRQLSISTADANFAGKRIAILYAAQGEVEQRSPKVGLGDFWKIPRNEPTPVSFRIAKMEACELYKKLPDDLSESGIGLTLEVAWYPGFAWHDRHRTGRTDPYATSKRIPARFEEDLAGLCGGKRRRPRR